MECIGAVACVGGLVGQYVEEEADPARPITLGAYRQKPGVVLAAPRLQLCGQVQKWRWQQPPLNE
jgi:hypothetical protein